MYDPITVLLTTTVIILSLVIITFFVVLIWVLLMVKRTLKKIDAAVMHVEHTAIRSLMPLLSFKAMFSDVSGFVESVKAWISVGKKKKARVVSQDD